MSLVAVTIGTAGATLDTERIHQLTCLRRAEQKKAGADRSASRATKSLFQSMANFGVTENELQAALKSAGEAGTNIFAIHYQVTGEQPRIIFFHCWSRGPAQRFAESTQEALPFGHAIYRPNLTSV